MKATGIVRRVDDLGRVVIPKEIRNSMKIREGEALEIYTDKGMVCFKKYDNEEARADAAAQWVNNNKARIISMMCIGDKTCVTFKMTNGSCHAQEVTRHPSDKFDMNMAICYCAKKAGFQIEGF